MGDLKQNRGNDSPGEDLNTSLGATVAGTDVLPLADLRFGQTSGRDVSLAALGFRVLLPINVDSSGHPPSGVDERPYTASIGKVEQS